MAIIYEVGFQADTDALQRQLAAINTDIKKAFTLHNSGNLGREVQQGVAAASTLKNVLQSASTQKGLSFVTMNTALKQSNTSAEELVRTLSGAGMTSSLNVMVESFTTANRTITSMNAKIAEMGRVMKQSFKFTAAQTALRFIDSVFVKGIRWSKDMNEALTNISIVTGKTGAALDDVFNQLVQGSENLKIAAKDYADASLIFYQQGLADDEVQKRTDITIKAAKASGEAVTEMSKQLTAVWSTYGMQGDQLEQAASQGAKLGAETAVDFEYIAQAMQISATAASQMGVSYESLASIIATVGSVTQQSASVVGNAFKTIFSRFEQLKATGTDGEVTLGQISQQLDDLGVHILDASGELRELDDVIMELGTTWDTYSKKQQLAISELVGGTRQFGQFLALMQNFDSYQKNLLSAQSETGGATLEAQYSIYLQSIEAMATQAGEAWAKAFGKIFDSEGLEAVYTVLADIGNIVGEIIDGLGGLSGILGYVAALMVTKIGPSFQKINIAVNEMWDNRNLETRMAAADKQYTAMITKVQAAASTQAVLSKNGGFTFTQEAADSTSRLKADNEYLMAKLNMSKQLVGVNIELQEVQQKGTSAEKAVATDQLTQLKILQEIYNKTLDEAKAIDLEAAAQERLNESTAANEKLQGRGINATDRAIGVDLMATGRKLQQEVIKGMTDPAGIAVIAEEFKRIGTVAATSKNKAVKAFGKNMAPLTEDIAQGGQTALLAMQSISKEVTQLESKGAVVKGTAASFDQLAQSILRVSEADQQALIQGENASQFVEASGARAMNFSAEISKMAGGLVGATVSLQNFFRMIKTGNVSLVGLVVTLSMLAPSLIRVGSSAKALAKGYSTLATTKGLIAAANGEETITTIANNTAKKVGIKLTKEENETERVQRQLKQIGIDVTLEEITIDGQLNKVKLEQILINKKLIKGQGELTAAEAKAGKAVGTTKMPIGGPILIAIGAIIAALTLLSKVEQANADQQREVADQAKQTASETLALSEEIRTNTAAVQENETAWDQAVLTSQDASQEYESLVKALGALNESLIDAGESQETLNQLMSEGLASGDLTEYYAEAAEAEHALYQQTIIDSEKAQKAQLVSAQSQMDSDAGIFNLKNPETITGDAYTGQTAYFSSETKEILESYSDLVGEMQDYDSTFTIDINFEDPVRFKEQYEELVSLKEDMESSFSTEELTDNKTYQDITTLIGTLSESYTYLSEQSTAAMDTIMDEMGPLIQEVDATSMSFWQSVPVVLDFAKAINAAGMAASLTSAEISNLIRTIIGMNPELNKSLTLMDQAAAITGNLVKSGDYAPDGLDNVKTDMDQITQTKKELEEGIDLSITQTWFDGESAEEEIARLTEETQASLVDMQNQLISDLGVNEALTDVFNTIDSLSAEDQDILLTIGVENISELDDITEKIDAYKDVEMRITIAPTIDASQLEPLNQVQSDMGAAVSEYAEDGLISLDTASALIALGPEYADYLMKIEGGYALTTEGVEAYTESLQSEEDVVNALLNSQIKPNESFSNFAYQMADIAAVADSSTLTTLTTQLEDLAIAFVNTGESAAFFDGVDEAFATFNAGAANLDLGADDIQSLTTTLQNLGLAVTAYQSAASEAFAAGDISMEEYYKDFEDSSGVALDIAKTSTEALTQYADEMGYVADANGDYVDSSGNATDATKEFSAAMKEAADNTADLEESTVELASFDGLVSAMQDNADAVDEYFTADWTLEPEVTLDEEAFKADLASIQPVLTSMVDVFNQEIESSIDGGVEYLISQETIAATEAELQGLIVDYAQYSSVIEGINTELLNRTYDATQHSFRENLYAIEVMAGSVMTEEEEAMNTVGQDIAAILDSIAQLVNEFDVSMTIAATGTINFTVPGADDIIKTFLSGGGVVSIKPEEGANSIELSVTGDASSGTMRNIDAVGDALTTASENNAARNATPTDWGDIMSDPDSWGTDDDKTQGSQQDLQNALDDYSGTPSTGEEESGGGSPAADSAEEATEAIEAETVAVEDLTDAYRELNIELDRTNAMYDKLSNTELYGLAEVQRLDLMNKSLEHQIELTEQLIEVDKTQKTAAREAITEYTGEDGYTMQFNTIGDIMNSDAIAAQYQAEAEAAAASYNQYIDAEGLIQPENQDAAEAAKKLSDEANERYQGYMDLLATSDDTTSKLLDDIATQSQQLAEQREKELEAATKYADMMYDLQEQAMDYADMIYDEMIKGAGIITDAFGNVVGVSDAVDRRWTNRTQQVQNYAAESAIIESGINSVMAEHESNGGPWTADEIAKLQEYSDALASVNEGLYELNDLMLSEIETVYTEWEDQLDRMYSSFQRQIDQIDSMKSILELSGPTWNFYADDQDSFIEMSKSQLEIMQNELASAKAIQEQTQHSLESMQTAYTEFLNMDTSNMTATQKQEWERELQSMEDDLKMMEDEAVEANNNFMQAYLDSMTQAFEVFQEEFDNIMLEMQQTISSDFYSDFDWMQDTYDYKMAVDDQYLNQAQSAYELITLKEDLLAYDTDDLEVQKGIDNLMADIVEKQESGERLTQYEVDILNERFNLLKAQADWEDAQKAKDSMKLTRDASGNWSYMYSSDESGMEDKARAIEDAANAIWQTAYEREKDTADMMMTLIEKTIAEIEGLDPNNPDFANQLADIYAVFTEASATILDFYNEAVIDSGAIQEDVVISEAENLEFLQEVEKMGAAVLDDVLGQELTDLLLSEEGHQKLADAVEVATEEMITAWDEWQQNIEINVEIAGEDIHTMGDVYEEEAGHMADSSEDMMNSIVDATQEAQKAIDDTIDMVSQWATDWVNQVALMIEANNELIKSMLDVEAAAMGVEVDEEGNITPSSDIDDYAYAMTMAYRASGYDSFEDFYNNDDYAKQLTEEREEKMDSGDYPNALTNEEFLHSMEYYEDIGVDPIVTKSDGTFFTVPDAQEIIDDSGSNADAYDYVNSDGYVSFNDIEQFMPAFASGGLATTPQIATLAEHGKELVLNPQDTINILEAVQAMREMVNMKMNGVNSNFFNQLTKALTASSGAQDINIDQKVQINADFPNVSSSSEIEAAFQNLVNRASQYSLKR